MIIHTKKTTNEIMHIMSQYICSYEEYCQMSYQDKVSGKYLYYGDLSNEGFYLTRIVVGEKGANVLIKGRFVGVEETDIQTFMIPNVNHVWSIIVSCGILTYGLLKGMNLVMIVFLIYGVFMGYTMLMDYRLFNEQLMHILE